MLRGIDAALYILSLDKDHKLFDNQPPHTRDFSRELGGFFLKYNGTYGII